MSTVRKLTPRFSQSFSAFPRVRFVVPKQGIVTAIISVRRLCRASIALTITSSASVLSSPPEMPTITFGQFICSIRRISPSDWMRSIASARSASISPSAGTNGRRGMRRVSAVSVRRWLKYILRQSGAALSSKLVHICRALVMRSISSSVDMSISAAYGFFSATFVPFSYTRQCPEKERSCVDSPCPALT